MANTDRRSKRALAAAILAAVLLLAAMLSLDHGWLTLTRLSEHREALALLVDQKPLSSAAGFAAVYVAVTALSIPGAVILTLAAGALFGLAWGTLIVAVASTTGATLAFLIARTLLRDWVQSRFGVRLARINAGFARDGNFYLFSLRLVPVVPFFVINILMGLTPIRTRSFFLVSLLGMFPATVVYVNAGTELSRIEQIGDILSPRLLLAFVLLAAFPWLARLLLRRLHRDPA